MFSARHARYVLDLVQDLASLARKILARFAYFLQDRFYWDRKAMLEEVYYAVINEWDNTQVLI